MRYIPTVAMFYYHFLPVSLMQISIEHKNFFLHSIDGFPIEIVEPQISKLIS